VTTNSKPPEICKEAFFQAREKLGLSVKELGGMACLSNRQIEQIENGETSSFYSLQIKVTAAKKVAKLLKLNEADAFNYGVQAPQKLNVTESEPPIAEAKLVKNPQTVDAEKALVSQENASSHASEMKEQAEEAQLPITVIAEQKEHTTKAQPKAVPFTRADTKSKPTSQKKLFLWLSVLAAGVFAVINVRPLFFADKPEEMIVVKEEMNEPAPPPAVAQNEPVPEVAPIAATSAAPLAVTTPALSIASAASGDCPAEEGIISYKPETARKPAVMVHVQTKSQQIICVIDASGKTQNKLLEPGAGTSFYGKPPFKVLTAGLSQVDIFFQGAKVRQSNPNTKTLILEAAEVAPPADRTDSQLR
jgi:transcriptional regulator with XRE-family HTH domain